VGRVIRSGASISAAAALGLLVTAACAPRGELRTRDAAGLDPKLSTFAYAEEGNLVSLIVDTRATRYRESTGYIPLEICVVNRGLPTLTLTREAFVLVDEAGNRYPTASPRELLEGYEYLDMDRRLTSLPEVLLPRFATYTRLPSQFSPLRQAARGPYVSNIVRDSLTLPRFGYLIDFLYFPMPKTGVRERRFELFLEAPELPAPVFVKFAVL
jgi:hypothetical protein